MRGVLDQFGAIDRGNEKWRIRGSRAAVFVNRAHELSFENRAINFAHLRGGGFVFDSDDDSIRMEEILDGSAFTQEFRIGNDMEGQAAVARIGVESAAEFEARACGNGALFDDEL